MRCICPGRLQRPTPNRRSHNHQRYTIEATNTPGAAPAGGKTLNLAFVTNNASDFWMVARKGVEKADAELENVSVEFKMPGEVAEQTRHIDYLLAKRVQGMAISPVDPANQTAILNKAAEQVLVFTQDSDAPKSKRACYIDTDNTDRAKAKSNALCALVKPPDLAGCVGLWLYNALAILSSVKAAKKVGKFQIVAFDEEGDTLAGVKSGAIYSTIFQQPFESGYRSIIKINKYLNGDKSVVPASAKIIVLTKAVSKADVDAFKADLDKLRGR